MLLSVLISIPSAIEAQETTSYRYDALGRLIEARVSGGVRDGLMASVSLDPSGNRLRFSVSGADGSGTVPPTPPPPTPPPPTPPPPTPPPPTPPPPINSPPITGDDALSVPKCGYGEVNVIANDTDPEGHLPLALVDAASANPVSSKGTPIIVSESTIGFEASPLGLTGGDTVMYRVRDSLGAIASGMLIVTIKSAGTCFQTPQKAMRKPP